MPGSRLKTLFFSCLFFLSLNLSAQNDNLAKQLTGTWKGIITQDEGGYRTEYEFELHLTLSGKRLTGRSYVYLEDIFAVMELSGNIKGKSMLFLEESIILDHRKQKDMEWCIKKMQLMFKYDGENLELKGYWSGKSILGDCIPGKIELKKYVPKA